MQNIKEIAYYDSLLPSSLWRGGGLPQRSDYLNDFQLFVCLILALPQVFIPLLFVKKYEKTQI